MELGEAEGDGEVDELYDEAVQLVVEMGKASTSALQRRLRIGYGRAASLLDAMERDGIIGPPDGSKPRAVLISKKDFLDEAVVRHHHGFSIPTRFTRDRNRTRSTGAVTIPIYQTSTYVQEGLGKHKGFEYARTQNPTRMALEKNMAVLERGVAAYAFASGMAATTALTQLLLKQGDHAICSDNVYGGTFRLFDKIVTALRRRLHVREHVEPARCRECDAAEYPHGLHRNADESDHVDHGYSRRLRRSRIDPMPGLSSTTPSCRLTFNGRSNLVPTSWFTVTTKYLNGHSDSVGGVAVLKRQDDADRLQFIQNAAGAILSPFDSWLVLRGIKTLPVRMEAHNVNGGVVAKYLAEHKKVVKVYYPGLPTHPGHELARKQMSGFGAMISFDVGSLDNAKRFLGRVKLCSLAESLGGVETLISHPATMTHASVPPEHRAKLGITDGLVRISVGIEDVDDLIADLDEAFQLGARGRKRVGTGSGWKQEMGRNGIREQEIESPPSRRRGRSLTPTFRSSSLATCFPSPSR